MKELRKKEFIEMLEKAELLFEDKDKFIHCDIPTLGKITYYPKANKVQISRTNTWEIDGLEYVRSILGSTTKPETKKTLFYENTSLAKIKEIKSEEELRDDFAGLAMQSLILRYDLEKPIESGTLSEKAYKIADNMIKQRKL